MTGAGGFGTNFGMLSESTAAFDTRFCLGPADTGQTYVPINRPPVPPLPAISVPLAVLQERAAQVRPWWLYKDYRAASPTQHFKTWKGTEPRYMPDPAGEPSSLSLLVDADGTAAADVWVCKEEAQTTATVSVPIKTVQVTVGCESGTGVALSKECGCGVGLGT